MVVDKLLKKYDKKVVVDSVSFSIPKGKVTSFIGPNGAGKSTVMGMISRLIANDAGIIEFQGKSMHDWKSKELAKHLAILTQSNNIQMKLTVEELVAFGRFPHSGGRLTDKDKDIINKSIEYMELNECSIIGNEIGFNNLGATGSTSAHGNEASFETVVAKNPEYIFVMDRDKAIGKAGAESAKEIVENDLVKSTPAYKNNHIVYLENPNVWYTAEGGIQALDMMLKDLEKGLGVK